ncbi:MAG: biotin/lipoyl-binding protein [Gloeobacteraceae cyanobacterium ES-bin-144]|nr:biotin/lipoyl-binding protein [Verrucomicrobiales bacterium]
MEHLRITVAGKVYDVIVEKFDSDETDHHPAPTPIVRASAPAAAAPRIAASTPAPAAAKPAAIGDTTSPLAGLVQAINAEVGATVNEGDTVITLEAMKMYTSITATTTGTVKAIHVKVGDAVDEGQALFTIG